ncbi:PREDICTED: ameloblastin isoform X1 [Chinchilla lanigera]|uniref:Ameloblastin n=1 Tax=Chinchilla lanigera TaxID=34839 RepID=A0A8C2V4W5_CHILA|nr:PREDICTED: ameloblastin isoform X1 [Chinchilla lanigera]
MSPSKIPLFKMKDLMLLLSLLKMSFAVPAFPQQPGAPNMAPPGMASLSLETMRQLGSLQGLNALSQYSRLGLGKSLNSLWLQGLLPPPSSFPWLRPREHETQQYEYSVPVHPPPLPSQPPQQPPQPGLKPFQQPTATPAVQDAPPKGGPQPPMHPRQLPLKDGELPEAQQQVAPTDMPLNPELPVLDFADPQISSVFQIARFVPRVLVPQNKPPTLYPGMLYMSYGTNQLSAPAARLGFMSSEEMPGGRASPVTYGALLPGFAGVRHTVRRMPQDPTMAGDFTLEFDSPAATKGPEKGEGGTQGSPLHETKAEDAENAALLSQIAPGARTGLLGFPNDNVPSMARGPSGQRKRPLEVTPVTADPLMTPELAEIYETYGADVTTPLGEATMETTMTPDTPQTLVPGNKARHPQMMHDPWRFQEP